ncbi:uncharacterized protein LOC110378377 [Helicoverpa armigera]|uniref:uncharacterized protein LOC110378377 n=1 Tax=Helicoverpa armigera TaxID=29058 RepID=UPI0030839AF3
MDKSSYLFMSKRKRLKFSFRAMDKNSSTDSNISLDSLETNFKRKPLSKCRKSDENVDTILVPFYEKDVLIKVPKDQHRKQNNSGNKFLKANEKLKRELTQANSYLVNKERDSKPKRLTYLEMFRKQFAPSHVDKKKDKNEIRSLSPEFGDTERESIGDETNNPVPEFYNTEPYNEMYYEKLLTRGIQHYLDNSYEEREEELQFTEDLAIKADHIRDPSPDNLRSVSEVTNSRRHVRRATIEPIQNLKLGGLGPDLERIKPRLERARSLQRYSEKVRMENRLKIYKKTYQAEIEKKTERDSSAKRREISVKREDTAKEPGAKLDVNPSYLINKSTNDKIPKTVKNPYYKSKSAGAQRIRERNSEKERLKQSAPKKRDTNVNQKTEAKPKIENKPDVNVQMRTDEKSKVRTKSSSKNKGINTESESEMPPVQISFMVNVGGVRQSSALKTLEEKHRMYQEQVKAFMENNNNG